MRSDKPSREQLLAAAGRTVPDVIAPGLTVLFCGINPGLYSGFTGHHFARPGNRFWPALHAAGFTPRVFRPDEQIELLPLGYGITNLVERATAAAAELSSGELMAGAQALSQKVARYRPLVVAVLGIGAHRQAFGRPRAASGLQPERIGPASLWVLPNPSGLAAHYTPAMLAEIYRTFREAATEGDRGIR